MMPESQIRCRNYGNIKLPGGVQNLKLPDSKGYLC